MERCRACNKLKPVEQFKKNNRKLNGRDSICKQCYAVRNRAYNQTYRETPAGAALLAWRRILWRCKNRADYQDIQVKFDRTSFIAWATSAYGLWLKTHKTTLGASVDRIRSTGHYAPGNVRLIHNSVNSAAAHRPENEHALADQTYKRCLRHKLDMRTVAIELLRLSKNKKPAQVLLSGL